MTEPGTRAGVPTPGAPAATGDAEAITTRERSQLQLVVSRFLRHRLAVGSLVVFLLVVAYAFIGPLFYPYGHTIYQDIPVNESPSWSHPFGTDYAGHDIFGVVMRGTQQSLKVTFTVALVATTIGSLWGAVAGFYRGWVDAVLMRIVDVILTVPLLVLVVALAGNVHGGTSWWAVALVIAAFGWTTTARVVRGVVLSLREQEFVEAARAMGASDARIVLRHLLPNTTGVIIVSGTLLIAFTILTEAALSFLGFGIQAPDTSLGRQIEESLGAVFTRPWVFYPPGIVIVLIALTANFIGDGLRDALDPRQTRMRR